MIRGSTEPPASLKRHGTLLVVLVAVLNGGSLAVLALASPLGGNLPSAGAVFPPWWSAPQVFEAAGRTGSILETALRGHVVFVRSGAPRLPARLRQAGALLTFSSAARAGCASVTEASRS